ncbi:MAG: TIGR02301 family protein [Caulobacter sp.]|nr:TIGR02301 family protein [Caulobacter sp.]
MTLFRTAFRPARRLGAPLATAAATLAGAALLWAGPAAAQDRSPAERQTLVDLAYAIGESHGLRQTCNGPTDQFWRDRMVQLSDTEVPDADFDARLKQAFNSGFATRQSQFPTCTLESRKAELAVARKGEALAQKLATSTRVVKRMGPDDPALKEDDPVSVETPSKPR